MATKAKPAKKGSSNISKLLGNPFYEAILHSLINYAQMSVHDPAARAQLKQGLQPLKDALDDLYADDSSNGKTASS